MLGRLRNCARAAQLRHVGIMHRFGMPALPALLQQYQSEGQKPETLAEISNLIKTEEHAHAMNAKLAQKSGSSHASSFHTPSILNLASRTALGRVDMSLVHDDIVAERIFKSFCVVHATEPRALLFETDWRGARSLIPRLLDNSFAFTIKYRTVQSTSTTAPLSAFHERVQELLRTETLPSGLELGEPRLLLQQTDSSTLLQPDEWQQVLQVCAEADTEAGWYLSFVASFPSDYAFDDISMAFIKQ